MGKYIYLLVGPSGSGKSTVADILNRKYGWKVVDSYTTRPPRYPDEKGHIFVTQYEFDKLDNRIAYTEFNGYEYCATLDQIEESDVYIIDPAGVDYFAAVYDGCKIPVIFYLDISEDDALINMLKRNDTESDAIRRIGNDAEEFTGFKEKLPSYHYKFLTKRGYRYHIIKSDASHSPEIIANQIYELRDKTISLDELKEFCDIYAAASENGVIGIYRTFNSGLDVWLTEDVFCSLFGERYTVAPSDPKFEDCEEWIHVEGYYRFHCLVDKNDAEI